jgi:membrane protease YdiL (CAAX protease family)
MSKESTNLAAAQEPHISPITWSPLTAVIVAVVIFLAAQLIAVGALSIYPALRHWPGAMGQDWLTNSVVGQFFFVVVAEGLTVLLLWLFMHWRKAPFRVLGFARPKLEDIAYALIGLVIYFPALIAAVALLHNFIPHFNINQSQQVGFQSGAHGSQLILVFVSLVVLPPLVEELMFRGFLFTSLRKKLPFVIAGLVTSLIFAAPHLLESGSGGLLWIAGVDTFILSLTLVWLREKTGRLYAGIGLHALKNGIAFAALFLMHH